jgi:hypothetical protein
MQNLSRFAGRGACAAQGRYICYAGGERFDADCQRILAIAWVRGAAKSAKLAVCMYTCGTLSSPASNAARS